MTETLSGRVAANVRAEIARRGLRQPAIAEACGLSQTGLSKRLNGHVPWGVNELAKAADALGVPVAVLLEQVQS